jgi:hypothetical protein
MGVAWIPWWWNERSARNTASTVHVVCPPSPPPELGSLQPRVRETSTLGPIKFMEDLPGDTETTCECCRRVLVLAAGAGVGRAGVYCSSAVFLGSFPAIHARSQVNMYGLWTHWVQKVVEGVKQPQNRGARNLDWERPGCRRSLDSIPRGNQCQPHYFYSEIPCI